MDFSFYLHQRYRLPLSLPSVGPGADPSVQAVSPQGTSVIQPKTWVKFKYDHPNAASYVDGVAEIVFDDQSRIVIYYRRK